LHDHFWWWWWRWRRGKFPLFLSFFLSLSLYLSLSYSKLTVLIIILRLVVFRHGQEIASGVGLGQGPRVAGRSIAFHKRCWDAAIFIHHSDLLAVLALNLQREVSQSDVRGVSSHDQLFSSTHERLTARWMMRNGIDPRESWLEVGDWDATYLVTHTSVQFQLDD
jgi:hypothetical protein